MIRLYSDRRPAIPTTWVVDVANLERVAPDLHRNRPPVRIGGGVADQRPDLLQRQTGDYIAHERAASRTPGLDGRDAELAATMTQLRALPTVAEVDDPSATLAALRALGVAGRAEFTRENRSVLTHLREDGALLHLYAYHFLYETGEPTTVEIALPGVGAAHRIDAWTGDIHPHQGVRHDGERTLVTVALAPGEPALLTLDRSAQEAPASDPPTEGPSRRSPSGRSSVESWDAGEPDGDQRGPRARLRDPRGAPDRRRSRRLDGGDDGPLRAVAGRSPRGRARGVSGVGRVHRRRCSSTTQPAGGTRVRATTSGRRPAGSGPCG